MLIIDALFIVIEKKMRLIIFFPEFFDGGVTQHVFLVYF